MTLIARLVSKKSLKYLKHRFLRTRVYQKLRSLLWPNHVLNYPFKCRRYRDQTDLFLEERRGGEPFPRLSVESYRELIRDDKHAEEVVQEVVHYYNSWLLKNRFCPSAVTVDDMDYMLRNTDGWGRRRRYLEFMFVREFDNWRHRREQMASKEVRRQERERRVSDFRGIGCFDDNEDIQYGFWRNTLFTRYYEKSVKNYSLTRLRSAALFGQKLVIDCSFDEEMQEYETQSVGRQMARIYHINRSDSAATEPFDLHFCSADPDSRVYRNLRKYLNPIHECDKHYLNVHRESYSELFPNERLIDLSPDARHLMTDFDPSATYILGSLVGKTCRLPLTKWKAEREGIECLKLPIHKYVALMPLVKRTLSFQSCFRILLEMKAHNDWKLAFSRGIQDHKLDAKSRAQSCDT